MKTIFYFFLALNLAMFIWQSNGSNDDGRAVASTAIPEGVKRLVMVDEANNKKLKSKDHLKIAKLTSQIGSSKVKEKRKKKKRRKNKGNLEVCYALGPFEAKNQVKSIANKLKDLGANTYDRQEKKRVPAGYWVYLPRFKSWNEARRKVVELEKTGLADVFIMGRGRMKNAVSLGLFKKQNAAKRRMSKLRNLGIKPKLEVQYSVSERYWIDIDVESGKTQVISAIEAIAKGLTILDLLPRKCG